MKQYLCRARRGLMFLALLVGAALTIAACGSSASSSSSSAPPAAAPAAATSSAAAPAAAASSATTSTPAGKQISLTVGYIGTQGVFPGPEGFAFTQGQLQKWLAPAGVTSIKAAGFANGPLLNAALVGGSVDVGVVGDTPALIARSQGAPTRVINQSQLNLASWIITKKSITSLSQLSGQSIARQQASYMDRYLQGVLQQNHLKANLIPMLFAQSIPAFNAGSIPAVVIIPALAPLVKVPYNVVARSADTPGLQGTSVTVATNKIRSADPGLPAAWNAARAKALQYAQANPAAYYAFQAKAQQTSVALAKQYYPLTNNPAQAFTPTGLASLQSTLNFLVQAKLAKPFTLTSWQTG
jgi:sulfonate transport system substrate-binding protein